MKKVILGVAIAGLVISCQKIQAGSNKGVLQLTPGVERYSEDMVTNTPSTAVTGSKTSAEMPMNDSLKTTTLTEVQIKKDSVQEMNTAPQPAATENK